MVRVKLSCAAVGAPNGGRFEFVFPLALCRAHAVTDVAAYVSERGWAQIVAGVERAGYATPDRRTLRVDGAVSLFTGLH